MLDTSSSITTAAGWALEKTALDTLGYCAPLPLGDPQLAQNIVESNIANEVYTRNPHTTSDAVRLMLNDTELSKAVSAICGANFKLWRSAFFKKSEGSGEIGWHHDKHFTSGNANIRLDDLAGHYSVLFALTSMTHTTGLLEVIPGTHRNVKGYDRDIRPFHLRPKNEHILPELPPKLMEMRRAVPIPKGCFIIFHSSILHRSLPHSSGRDRLGMAIRLAHSTREIPSEMAEPKDILSFPPIV